MSSMMQFSSGCSVLQNLSTLQLKMKSDPEGYKSELSLIYNQFMSSLDLLRQLHFSTNTKVMIEAHDLLLEIFLRLPFPSIQRFKTACKHWRSLITNPTFRKLWCKRNLKPSTGLFLDDWESGLTYFVPFSSNKPTPLNINLVIRQSCNGLLLCSTTKNKYHVYNPTTNTCFTLPKLGKDVIMDGSRIRSMSLAYDPHRFGHHCYKVICCVSLLEESLVRQIYVYSSDTGLWKQIYVFTRCVNDRGVYWNGCIHWMLPLTYFDIEKKTLNRMPEPPTGGNRRKDHHYLGESCDRLIYTKFCKGRSHSSVDVCEMKRDYSGWVLKYHVELDNQHIGTSVLSVNHGPEDDEYSLVFKRGKGIVRYNIVSKISEELHVLPSGDGTIDSAFQYIESQCRV